MESSRTRVYPFSAIVGQGLLKKALLLNAVDPGIGGVLIRGQRGTAKSTAVRSLAALLPLQETVSGCPYNLDPQSPCFCIFSCPYAEGRKAVPVPMQVVELPVSATEDKVVGAIDIAAAIKEGRKKFEPGILARANRNILYVDEVNLLSDHIVDALLDTAAMGVNTVEREGISYSHPSRFILVGTMNPEEGDLRPQLLDRFGLCVNIVGIRDPQLRITILKRLQRFGVDPDGFIAQWQESDRVLTEKVVAARERLPQVQLGEAMLKLAIRMCEEAHVEGHRADLVVARTAKAIAAYDGRADVTEPDVRLAAALALAHRARDPPPPPEDQSDEQDDQDSDDQDDDRKDQRRDGDDDQQQEGGSPPPPDDSQDQADQPPSRGGEPTGTVQFQTGQEFKVKQSALNQRLRLDSLVRDGSGRRSETESSEGRYVGYRLPREKPTSIAFDATLRAAALHQKGAAGSTALHIAPQDVREKVKERKTGNLIVFAVDASGSMGAQQRMSAVKGAIASLLTDAYQKRDRVALVVFRGTTAETVLPPTSSIVLAKRSMDEIPTGGKTPLAAGLVKAQELIAAELKRNGKVRPLLVIISDGRANVPLGDGKPMEELRTVAAQLGEEKYLKVVIDSETGALTLGFAKRLADEMGAKYVKIEDLRAETVSSVVGSLVSLL